MDGKYNHSMGSPMDGTPHSPKTDSDGLIKDNRLSLNRRSLSVFGLWECPVHRTPHAVLTLTIHYDQQLHAAIIQYTSNTLTIFAPGLSVAVYNEHM